MYTVYYRCLYREHWYEYAEAPNFQMARQYAAALEGMGRTALITDPDGNQVYP
jgi:hypothetical protein